MDAKWTNCGIVLFFEWVSLTQSEKLVFMVLQHFKLILHFAFLMKLVFFGLIFELHEISLLLFIVNLFKDWHSRLVMFSIPCTPHTLLELLLLNYFSSSFYLSVPILFCLLTSPDSKNSGMKFIHHLKPSLSVHLLVFSKID